jgi:hypothetical protein
MLTVEPYFPNSMPTAISALILHMSRTSARAAHLGLGHGGRRHYGAPLTIHSGGRGRYRAEASGVLKGASQVNL